jgi:hypothetical protein
METLIRIRERGKQECALTAASLLMEDLARNSEGIFAIKLIAFYFKSHLSKLGFQSVKEKRPASDSLRLGSGKANHNAKEAQP